MTGENGSHAQQLQDNPARSSIAGDPGTVNNAELNQTDCGRADEHLPSNLDQARNLKSRPSPALFMATEVEIGTAQLPGVDSGAAWQSEIATQGSREAPVQRRLTPFWSPPEVSSGTRRGIGV